MHRYLFQTILLVTAVSAAKLAPAMGLGAAQVKSALGQPLTVVIPVATDGSEEVRDGCFALAQPGQANDNLPALKKARLLLKNSAGGTYLLLTTQNAINEPVLVFAIEARCPGIVRRDYALLLDLSDNAAAPVAASSPPLVSAVKPFTSAAPASSGSADRYKHARTQHVARDRKVPPTTAALPAAVPERELSLRMSSGLTWLPGQHPLSAAQLSTLKRMRGMLSIDAGGAQAAEADKLRDDIAATRQQLAQAKQALAQLRAQLPKPAATQPAALPAVVKPSSWWQSGWLWSGLALTVLVVGYLVDRRRKLPDLMLSVPHAETGAVSNIKLGAVAKVDTATNDLWAHVVDPDAPTASQQHPDIEFSVDRLPGHSLLNQSAVQNTSVHAEALSVSKLMRVTEEAEVFLGLGYTDRAIAVLTEDIAANLRNHPAVWFMLLGIYREQGDKAAFDQTVAGFRQRFNLIAPTWDSIQQAEQEGEGVLAMPHIQAKIVSLWPSHECHDFLSELLYDNRQGSRQGFSLDVYRDILWLKEILDVLSMPETTIAEEVAADDNLDWDFQ